jgi:predicted Ser/Thr protein kinase
VVGNQSIEVAIIDYEKYLSGIRKGTRQVKQATARLLRVFRSASIRRLEEISADAIHEAVESFESEKGGEE